jgi:trans-aconitate methyltransferase
MLWRSTYQTMALFEAWKQEWLVFQKHDQLELARALQKRPIQVVQLPDIYNFPVHQVTREVVQRNEVKLLHCLRGFVRVGRFQQVAQRLMPEATQLALQMLAR